MERLKRYGIPALLLIVLVSVSVNLRSCYLTNEWEDQVASVQAFADSAVARADSLTGVADALTAEATILANRAQRLEYSADSITEAIRFDYPDTEQRIYTTRADTPLDLADHPAIVERDALIDDLYKETQSWEVAYATLKASNNDLKDSNQALRLSQDALRGALAEATTAVDSLNAVLDARPSRPRWWIPEVGVGPSLGLTTDGTAYAGVGVNLSWSLPIG